MRKWSFYFFVLAFMHPASALADDGADEKAWSVLLHGFS